MQANLIFNPTAGVQRNKATSHDIQAALKQQGYQPVHRFTECEEDLDTVLNEVEGLVVVAGGDGTLRAVITRLIGKKETPILHLPMGTANNIAQALNIPRDPIQLIEGLNSKKVMSFDVGKVTAPWGRDYFLEGSGFGFFADILTSYDPSQGKSVLRSVKAFTKILLEERTYGVTLSVDGEEISGNYLLVEMLNTTAVGPRLKFAPDATPHDGLLDVLCIRESDRNNFLQYLTSMVREDMEKLETVEVRKARKIELEWDGYPVHIDAELRPPGIETEMNESDYKLAKTSGKLSVEALPGAVELWLPQLQKENA